MSRRRRWVLGSGAAVAFAALGLHAERRRRWRKASDEHANRRPERPDAVPVGPFGAQSTAEEVTAGVDLSEKVFLVTGVTSGIGLETMRVLALRGAHVIGTGRTIEKATAACRSVTGRTTPMALELTDYQSVRACAARVRSATPQLDVLVANAGIMALPSLEQVSGVEKQFATNHLGHFLLTRHLMSSLRAAPQARIVVVSSQVLSWSHPAGIEWDNLSGEQAYDPNRAYGQSKLANALFALELSRRLAGTSMTANSLHPGYVDTDLFRHYPVSLTGFRGLFSRSRKTTVAQGAATTCYVATSPLLKAVSGLFFKDCNPVVPDERAANDDQARRLWNVSERLLAGSL